MTIQSALYFAQGQHLRSARRLPYNGHRPKLTGFLRDAHGLAAMSRAHREIQHLARLLNRIAEGLTLRDIDRYLVRDAQRVIEALV